jgi:thiol-disulfide isomerase/thioredoxin
MGRMRRLLVVAGVLALTVVLVLGLRQAGGGGEDLTESARFDVAAAKQQLRGAPPALAALHDQSGELLEGGEDAFAARLKELRGHPVVINKWASWCDPCRDEFPAFQRVGMERGREVAFLGLNAKDSRRPAERFAERFPTPYPSYVDPDEEIARSLKVPAFYPVTVFVDAKGKTAFIHQGAYRDTKSLEEDIDRYLGAAGT